VSIYRAENYKSDEPCGEDYTYTGIAIDITPTSYGHIQVDFRTFYSTGTYLGIASVDISLTKAREHGIYESLSRL
jgi:hypothetical protein